MHGLEGQKGTEGAFKSVSRRESSGLLYKMISRCFSEFH